MFAINNFSPTTLCWLTYVRWLALPVNFPQPKLSKKGVSTEGLSRPNCHVGVSVGTALIVSWWKPPGAATFPGQGIPAVEE